MIIFGNCYDKIKDIDDESINAIITDPPYQISRKSGYTNGKLSKYKTHTIDFGEWDKIKIDYALLFKEFYRVLKPSGTLLIFYDLWKCNELKEFAEKCKFKQPRACQWIKTNPVPINSKINYLSNAIEFFFTFVKGSNPTYHSEYDNGVYSYPICHGKERLKHPTQKPLQLMEDIVLKHTNKGDVVLDVFAGTGTTGIACMRNDRECIMIENNKDYYDLAVKRLKDEENDLKLL